MVSTHPVYVYADHDWRLWQRTRRTPEQTGATTTTTNRLTPALALLFALAMLLLWWRERR